MASKQNMKKDERFSRVMKDPRFWEMPEKERKVKIDKRFQSMFYDKKFKLKYTVDKRGRPINHTSTDDLKRFYALSDSDISEQEDKEQCEKIKKKKVRSKAKQGSKEEKALSLSGDDGRKCRVTKKNQLSVIERKSSKLTKQAKGEKAKAEKTHKGIKVFSKDQHEDTMHGKKAAPADVLPIAGIDIKSSAEEDTESEADEDDESTVGTSSTDEEGSSVEENDSLEAETTEDEIDEEEDSDSGEESDFGPDLARGMGNIETSSDEDEENDMTELLHAEEEIEHDWGELWKDAPRGEDVTRRLALCNIDWERLKAKDLLAVFNSFKPKGGIVYSVKIYPSDFGKERTKKEEQQGPLELVTLPEDPDEDNEAQRLYREKMREYQFKRMRYYYAVVDCDSPETASKIYEECDGHEYESSCSVMDLRFIPDDVTFDDEPKDVAADVDLAAYTPKYFSSSATATSKVELTWDETDHDRVTLLNRKFKKDEILSMDFNAYLASSSEDEGVDDDSVDDKETQVEKMDGAEVVQNKKLGKAKKDDEEQISKYRDLLKSIQNKEKTHKDIDMEMQIKWVPGLKETTEKLVKQKLEGKEKLTPWEEFLKKKKEKKLQKKKQGKNTVSPEEQISDDELPPDVDLNDSYFAEEIGQLGTGQKASKKSKKKEEKDPEEVAEIEKQRAEMTLLMMDDEDESRKHFNYDKIVEQQNLSKQKRKKLMKQEELLEEDTFQVDVSDPRFNAMYTSHLYNLDPADPAYKKTRGTEKIIEEKLRRREHQHQSQEGSQKGMVRNKRQLSEEEEEEKSKGTVPVQTKLEPGLSMLIKSIKSKTEQFQARKKQKTSTS
ncbi:ESF1 homolog isoform X3 [Erpetoichthys calabaricus]|uniref:ESF1 homolog isoform X3 n=1 Tax=Erpetoichthys calabaricus TaxID=27687 RepID=UPI00109FFF04|nr:ESF1 homolog isoform X3 [Erpetoichthys calabaricus]